MREHCVIDSAAYNAEGGGSLQCIGVFITAERDDGQPFANAADEEHGLLGADAVLARHPGQRGVNFGQTVRAAASSRPIESDE